MKNKYTWLFKNKYIIYNKISFTAIQGIKVCYENISFESLLIKSSRMIVLIYTKRIERFSKIYVKNV